MKEENQPTRNSVEENEQKMKPETEGRGEKKRREERTIEWNEE